MAKGDRTGNRITREQRKCRKTPKLGYYVIVTDTEATERCFFTGFYDSLPKDIRDKIVIKVVETKTPIMIDKCLEYQAYDPQYRIPWIVFDRDQMQGFDEMIKEAKNRGINVGWSNPCFEIWMYAYFGSMPAIRESWTCVLHFKQEYEKKTGHKYSKSDDKIYERLCKVGDESKAIRIAEQKYKQCIRDGKTRPSEMCPCTTIMVQLSRQKIEIFIMNRFRFIRVCLHKLNKAS
ncbi:MAG: RloB family protein [Bacteroidota bacterium]|nr:RloB family protein [Bacteroidota bacterium]